jgi:hypothetical protein
MVLDLGFRAKRLDLGFLGGFTVCKGCLNTTAQRGWDLFKVLKRAFGLQRAGFTG